MSRPKGSKNKKTLEKENSVAVSVENNLGGVNEEKNGPSDEEKNIPEAQENTSPENILTEDNSIHSSDEDNFEYENEMPPEPSRMRSKSNEKTPSVCKRCGKELITAPCRVDTNMIAGRVSTHREHPRFVTICIGCASELSELVDNWLGNYPSKWEDHSDGY